MYKKNIQIKRYILRTIDSCKNIYIKIDIYSNITFILKKLSFDFNKEIV